MRYVSSKEVRSNSAVLWKDKETIITIKGKPVALVTRIEGDPTEVLLLMKRIKAMFAVEKMGTISKEKGLDKLSDEDISRMIDEIRKESGR